MALIGVTLISAPSEGAQVKQHSQFSWSHGGSGWVLAEAIWIRHDQTLYYILTSIDPMFLWMFKFPPLRWELGFGPPSRTSLINLFEASLVDLGSCYSATAARAVGLQPLMGDDFPVNFWSISPPNCIHSNLESNGMKLTCLLQAVRLLWYIIHTYIDAPKQKLPTQWLHHAIWKGLAVQFYSQKPPNGSDASNGGDDAGLPASNAEHRSPIMLLKRGKRGIQPEISGILALLNKSKHPNRNNTTKFTNARRAFSP